MSAPTPPVRPLVSIIIPAWNKWDYTFRCLVSLLEQTREVSTETIVIDNASTDETAAALPLLPGLRFHRNASNLGFAKACNQGAALARAPLLLFLNNDTEARPGWLPPLVRAMESAPDVAMVGAKLLYPDGSLQHAGVAVGYAMPLPITPFHLHARQPPEVSSQQLELSAVTAACMLVKAEVFHALGGFDEAYVNGYEDMDLCFKVREAGHRILYSPESVLVHHESVSDGRFLQAAHNEDLLNRRWMDRFTAFDVDCRREPPPAAPAPGRPGLSLVVPVKDALRTIAPCLENLARNLGPADEIVVADAGSTDCTLQFVARFAAARPGQVKVVERPGGLPAAAAAGLATARHGVTILVHPALRAPDGFADTLTSALSRLGTDGLIGIPMPGIGFCAAATTVLLRGLAQRSPEALFQDRTPELEVAVKRQGRARLVLTAPVGPGTR